MEQLKELVAAAFLQLDKLELHRLPLYREITTGDRAALLPYWLYFVAALSTSGVVIALLYPTGLKTKQFSNKPERVNPTAENLFAAWVSLATLIRILCAMYSHEIAIFRAAFGTFVVADLFYTYETFIAQSIPLRNSFSPLLVASLSLYLMYPFLR